MKKGICMRLGCETCHKVYDIPSGERYWDYNIFRTNEDGFSKPCLLCPTCTDKAVKNLK